MYGSEILWKISAKLRICSQKKFEIFEIQNFNEIPSFTISFLFFFAFLAFCFLFHLSKLIQKLFNFLYCFIRRVRDFTNYFCKILKVLFKKIDMWNILFFKILWFAICFFYFFLIFDILFSISSICTCQKIIQTFMIFYFMDQRFYQRILENHWKYFSKKYRH